MIVRVGLLPPTNLPKSAETIQPRCDSRLISIIESRDGRVVTLAGAEPEAVAESPGGMRRLSS
jgi:hypothetical protein